MLNSVPPLEIVIGEDNPADSRLISLCLEGWEISATFSYFASGRKLKTYLESRPTTSAPMIVMLDFFLSEIEGPRLLRWIREESLYPQVPVVLMSGSYLEEVMDRSYRFGGNYFLEKSTDLEQFFLELRSILSFLVCGLTVPK